MLWSRNRRQTRMRESANVHGLQGAPPRLVSLFLSRVQDGNPDTVKAYMADKNVKVYSNEIMSHPDSVYLSFKVSISKSDVKKVLRPWFWPSGIKCKIWRNRNNSNDVFDNESNMGYPQDADDNETY